MHIAPAAVFRLCYRDKSGNVGFNNSQGQITESGTLKKRKRIASPFPVLPFFRVVVVATTVEGKGHTNRMRKEQQAFLFPFLFPSCGECSQVPRSLPLLSLFPFLLHCTHYTGGPPILPPLAISEGYEKEKEEWFHVALAASLCRLFLLFPSTPPLPPPGSLNVKDIYLFLTASVVPPLLSLRSMPPLQTAPWPPLLLQVQSPPLPSLLSSLCGGHCLRKVHHHSPLLLLLFRRSSPWREERGTMAGGPGIIEGYTEKTFGTGIEVRGQEVLILSISLSLFPCRVRTKEKIPE